MEQGKPTKSSSSSSSSITSEIFPSKVPPSSSSKILDSVFPPQPEVPEGQSLVSKMQDSPNEPLKTKPANSGHEGKSQSAANKEESSFFMEPCIPPPCHLSSSIFYGAQDIFPIPQTKKNTVYYDDDESGYATRGNWWKGSFYY
ncbi:hypothetical protein V6N13_080135 [Hibiscus sabdariffa]|uniref:Uncharacterized protein n=1 Tax=Hibiscus sabdariffa TaxID=183260 RepID=A0ABR2PY36_9ROSI